MRLKFKLLKCICLMKMSKAPGKMNNRKTLTIKHLRRVMPFWSKTWLPHRSSIIQFPKGHSASSPSLASNSPPPPDHQAKISLLQAPTLTAPSHQPQAASTQPRQPDTYHLQNIQQHQNHMLLQHPHNLTIATEKRYKVTYRINICSIELINWKL